MTTQITFSDRMREAEAAIKARRARNIPPRRQAKKPAEPKAPDLGQSNEQLFKLLTAHLDQREARMRHDLNEVIENVLDSVREHHIVVTENGDEVGKIEGLQHKQLADLIRLATVRNRRGYRKNIMVKGPMGGGKSTAGRQMAEAFGLPFGYLGQTEMPHDVIGYVHPVTNEYVSTEFVKAFINGGVIVLEEMDSWSPRATLVTNVPLANDYITLPNGEHHKRHPDCIVMACTNTWGNGPTAEYVGRNKLDAAFLDRFAIKLDWQYDDKLERTAAANDEVVDAVQRCRFNANHYGIKVAISPRSSIDIADMVRAGFGIREAMEYNFLAGLTREVANKLLEDVDV